MQHAAYPSTLSNASIGSPGDACAIGLRNQPQPTQLSKSKCSVRMARARGLRMQHERPVAVFHSAISEQFPLVSLATCGPPPPPPPPTHPPKWPPPTRFSRSSSLSPLPIAIPQWTSDFHSLGHSKSYGTFHAPPLSSPLPPPMMYGSREHGQRKREVDVKWKACWSWSNTS